MKAVGAIEAVGADGTSSSSSFLSNGSLPPNRSLGIEPKKALAEATFSVSSRKWSLTRFSGHGLCGDHAAGLAAL